MHYQKLNQILLELKIPKDSYSIGSIKDEALCLIDSYEKWFIFYSERGKKTEEEFFSHEDLACEAFLLRLKKMLQINN